MKPKTSGKIFDHSGSSFDSFLGEEGIREEVESIAVKRVLAWQLERAMRKRQKTKQAMAGELRTSRSQLDRLLDPRNVSRSEEHTSELQSRPHLVCRLLLEKKKTVILKRLKLRVRG